MTERTTKHGLQVATNAVQQFIDDPGAARHRRGAGQILEGL